LADEKPPIGPEREYWRTPGERFRPEAREPESPLVSGPAVGRRTFLGLAAASAALAACSRPPGRRIVPWVRQPPELVPGVPVAYATSMVQDGFATGLLVTARDGRPIRVDGNPDHPASLGGSSAAQQAAVYGLYDPDRGRGVERRGVPSTWEAFRSAFHGETRTASSASDRGEGLHLVLEPTGSPLVGTLLERLQERYPEARVHFFSNKPRGETDSHARIFGVPALALADLSKASVVVSLDSDFLAHGPMHLRHARQFADGRRLSGGGLEMNRLYVAEPAPTVTGMSADGRHVVRATDIASVARSLTAEIASARPDALPAGVRQVLARARAGEEWIRAAARDLLRAGPHGFVIAGTRQPAAVHALVHTANVALGCVGTTVSHVPSPLLEERAGREDFGSALQNGRVMRLLILQGNPAFEAGAQWAELLRAVPASAYLGLYRNETAEACEWNLPAAHFLESWGDARSAEGTVSIVQPLVEPLFAGRNAAQLLAMLLGERDAGGHAMLDDSLRNVLAGASDPISFREARDRAVEKGFVEGTASAPLAAETRWNELVALLGEIPRPWVGLEAVLHEDSKTCGGRHANNPLLQELPDPVTKLTWDNAACMSPAMAETLKIETGRMVEISAGTQRIIVPALVLPGHADGSISMALGYGRTSAAENVARGVGADAGIMRGGASDWVVKGVSVKALESRRDLAVTQEHWSLEGRPILREMTLSQAQGGARAGPASRPLSLYRPERRGTQWAMAIDLTACTGCSACVVACQTENNIPVVGREEVLRSREMHWLRIDWYFSGDPRHPRMLVQPMLCQHCEQAPCEYVCPVNATTHSPDGLNEMTYNRCVGTRFCSNNCPYKVRRFNYLDHTSQTPPLVQLAKNPDVTVRERGVMEKCTYCVQRVRKAEIAARGEGRPLRRDEVRTACQDACPSRAIVFGDLSDPESEVSRWANSPRAYRALEDRGTDARTRYLAKVTNPPQGEG